MSFQSISPYTEEVLAETRAWTDAEIDVGLGSLGESQQPWRRYTLEERADVIRRLGELLVEQRESLAAEITAEMGKLRSEALAEIDKCAWLCEYYAEHGPTFLSDEEIATDARRSLVAYQPLGILLAIMPWNFPFWQVFRAAVPAVAAGNVVALKHAPNVQGCAAAIELLFRRASEDAGVLRNFPVDTDAAQSMLRDPRIAAATLTGSTRAGSAVGRTAGQALKKTVLELGGSDCFIVLEDANLDLAADMAVRSRFQNAGQSCIAAKRFIVCKQVVDEFRYRLEKRVKALRPGDPETAETTLAPMARSDLRNSLHRQVRRSLDRGAELVTGGHLHGERGYFYAPTILAGVEPGMPAFEEELFGPVAVLITARDERRAVDLANASSFGLGGSVWTDDRERGERVARELQCGCAFVNQMVKSDPRVPFGGVKRSGHGRELARQGIREFVNVKTVWIE